MKNGRAGSSAVNVLIQAPPIPNDNSKNGPTQQAEAPTAAKRAPIPNHDGVFMDISGSVFIAIS
jgi:hypothetical protein